MNLPLTFGPVSPWDQKGRWYTGVAGLGAVTARDGLMMRPMPFQRLPDGSSTPGCVPKWYPPGMAPAMSCPPPSVLSTCGCTLSDAMPPRAFPVTSKPPIVATPITAGLSSLPMWAYALGALGLLYAFRKG
jgi:hypothetical protein